MFWELPSTSHCPLAADGISSVQRRLSRRHIMEFRSTSRQVEKLRRLMKWDEDDSSENKTKKTTLRAALFVRKWSLSISLFSAWPGSSSTLWFLKNSSEMSSLYSESIYFVHFVFIGNQMHLDVCHNVLIIFSSWDRSLWGTISQQGH